PGRRTRRTQTRRNRDTGGRTGRRARPRDRRQRARLEGHAPRESPRGRRDRRPLHHLLRPVHVPLPHPRARRPRHDAPVRDDGAGAHAVHGLTLVGGTGPRVESLRKRLRTFAIQTTPHLMLIPRGRTPRHARVATTRPRRSSVCTLPAAAGSAASPAMSPETTTKDEAFMEPRGCNQWLLVANRPGLKTAKASQNRC